MYNLRPKDPQKPLEKIIGANLIDNLYMFNIYFRT